MLATLDPDAFERRIQLWIHALLGSPTEGKHIAIDGKTLRRSFDHASGKAAIHMINAYVHENHAVFGQVKVDDKSNEITAIPALLEMLQLKDATVTIDAIGCQRDIAGQIIDRHGHYVLALKANQSRLQEDVKTFMQDRIARAVTDDGDYYETVEKSHGRIETRKCWTCWDVDWLTQRHAWPGLACMTVVEATRTAHGKTSTERRYFISSHSGRQAQKLATLIRNHWRVENQLHWTLDVSFNEGPMPRTNRKRRRESGSDPPNQPDLTEAGKDLQVGHQEQTRQSRLRQKLPAQAPRLQGLRNPKTDLKLFMRLP